MAARVRNQRAGIDIAGNTHVHLDHCAGNHLFAGRPIYEQHGKVDARSEDDYTTMFVPAMVAHLASTRMRPAGPRATYLRRGA